MGAAAAARADHHSFGESDAASDGALGGDAVFVAGDAEFDESREVAAVFDFGAAGVGGGSACFLFGAAVGGPAC